MFSSAHFGPPFRGFRPLWDPVFHYSGRFSDDPRLFTMDDLLSMMDDPRLYLRDAPHMPMRQNCGPRARPHHFMGPPHHFPRRPPFHPRGHHFGGFHNRPWDPRYHPRPHCPLTGPINYHFMENYIGNKKEKGNNQAPDRSAKEEQGRDLEDNCQDNELWMTTNNRNKVTQIFIAPFTEKEVEVSAEGGNGVMIEASNLHAGSTVASMVKILPPPFERSYTVSHFQRDPLFSSLQSLMNKKLHNHKENNN